ncbi:mucin-1-like [Vigna umbellata]|uniref:mucin-1-like n=1 Tax=Vigna umbellata TaxID=87088 RepID=UPI001F5F7E9F|nr:mucin-1-like [Vigna umbellata]
MGLLLPCRNSPRHSPSAPPYMSTANSSLHSRLILNPSPLQLYPPPSPATSSYHHPPKAPAANSLPEPLDHTHREEASTAHTAPPPTPTASPPSRTFSSRATASHPAAAPRPTRLGAAASTLRSAGLPLSHHLRSHAYRGHLPGKRGRHPPKAGPAPSLLLGRATARFSACRCAARITQTRRYSGREPPPPTDEESISFATKKAT